MKVVFCLLAFLGLIAFAYATSHGEAPWITKRPQIDPTDVYAFRSYEPGREDFVTFLVNYLPLQDAFAGPNYFSLSTNHYYEIYIDNDGDGVEDITFQFTYETELPNPTGISLNVGGQSIPIALKTAGSISAGDNSALNWLEFYSLNIISGGPRENQNLAQRVRNARTGGTSFVKPFDYAGRKTFPDYEAYVNQYIYDITIPGCSDGGRVFVGQRQEPFSVNLGPIFDLINFVPLDGSQVPGGITSSPANNLLSKKNIATFALEVPISCVTGTDGIIGVWTGTRGIRSGKQKARLGFPLVNEVLIGLKDKGLYNKGSPANDESFLKYVTNPTLPAIIDLLFRGPLGATSNIAPSNFPRNDLIAAILTGVDGLNKPSFTPTVLADQLRLNLNIAPAAVADQKTFGVLDGDAAGFPNGRRPGDDVIDIVLRVAMGRLCHPPFAGAFCNPSDAPVGNAPISDGAPVTAADFQASFPYFNTPIPGA